MAAGDPGARGWLAAVRLSDEALAAVRGAAEGEGLSCRAFDDAARAAAAIEADPPACVVVEAGLIPFCGQLRHHGPVRHVPALLLARPREASAVSLALQSGVSDVAMLPVNPPELRLRLARLLRPGPGADEAGPPAPAPERDACAAASELRIKQALKNMPVMVFAADEDGCILFFNPEFERVTGYTAEDVLRAPQALELLTPREECLLPARCDLPGGTLGEQHRRWTFQAKDGGERTIIWSNISERCPIQGWTRWGVGLDITEHVRLERLREEVERVVRHDLRNPVTAVVGLAALLREDPGLDARQREIVDRIAQSAGRITRIVENSLAFYRIERGTYLHMPVDVDLADVARTIAEELGHLAGMRGQTLRLELDGRPLAPEDALPVQANRSLLENIVANLLKNALEAAPDGAAVRLSLLPPARPGEAARLAVHNPGVISPAMRPRLFSRYETDKPGGTGLGLYSARLTAEVMDGSVTWTSSERDGTAFILHLPV